MSTVATASKPAAPSMPSEKALVAAAKLAMEDDRPIMMDYWLPSHPGGDSTGATAVLGIKPNNGGKLLIKSEQEYTSDIRNIYQCENTFIIKTENSLYLVSNSIAKCAIQE